MAAGGFVGVDLNSTDEVEFPLAVVVDRTYLLNVLDGDVWASVVFAEDEVRPPYLEVPSFREADVVVFRVVTEAILLERDRRAWVVVAVFAVSVRPLVSRTIRTDAPRP